MVQLKCLYKDDWVLIPGPEFTEEELEPLKENMKRAGVAILESGERVRVPFSGVYSKSNLVSSIVKFLSSCIYFLSFITLITLNLL